MVEELLRYIYQQRQIFGYLAHQFYNLRDVVVVFAVLRSGSRFKQAITICDQLKHLENKIVNNRSIVGDVGTGLTTHATLHISALIPHFAPRITSRQWYCCVWISSMKWCSV
jgi:hypothetical protein